LPSLYQFALHKIYRSYFPSRGHQKETQKVFFGLQIWQSWSEKEAVTKIDNIAGTSVFMKIDQHFPKNPET
jgi:hypothetical protein